jgi:hypothetical protein
LREEIAKKSGSKMPRIPTPKLLIIGDETVQVAMPRVTYLRKDLKVLVNSKTD